MAREEGVGGSAEVPGPEHAWRCSRMAVIYGLVILGLVISSFGLLLSFGMQYSCPPCSSSSLLELSICEFFRAFWALCLSM